MKISIIVGFVGVLVLVDLCLSEEQDVRKMFAESAKQCLKTLSPANAQLVRDDQKVDNEEIRCYKKCTLENLGIISHGQINMPLFEELVKQIKPIEKREALLEAVKKCADSTILNKSNECGVGALYYDCISRVRIS